MTVEVVIKIRETVDVKNSPLSTEQEKFNCASEAFINLLDIYPQLSEFECELSSVYQGGKQFYYDP
jgi:hypothetical protein